MNLAKEANGHPSLEGKITWNAAFTKALHCFETYQSLSSEALENGTIQINSQQITN